MLAPADGRVAFVGRVAGRAVVSVDHVAPDGVGILRTTYEPVVAAVAVGATIRRGEVLGDLGPAASSHCAATGCLHWGARRDETYVDPMSLLGGRVRLWTPREGSVPPRATHGRDVSGQRAPGTG
ncbi:hypothetical protein MOPEL_007_00080 [Mobilicoccus pelagius NBRC 104925]|uniref:M23ase beta-sheet core domain-containing protein n=1 Tax=Mobilicoccus pelagius NBRC 104925 TaxID=1089455 RepID=H5UN83_9MICO|nr:hypothetical protein MOPEL_007_00080 [Mobilicoccus pelagius NBRC 104925]